MVQGETGDNNPISIFRQEEFGVGFAMIVERSPLTRLPPQRASAAARLSVKSTRGSS